MGKAPSVASATRHPGGLLLVVDDDDLVREVVATVLRSEGFEVRTAGSGAAALEAIRSEAFHLVLMDVQMPGMDGWTALATLRERGCDTPVVMMSGYATEAEALHRGAAGFLSKPFDHARLVEAVSRWATPAFGAAAG